MQGELFDDMPKVNFEGGLECNNCGIKKPIKNFTTMPSGEIKRKCRQCAREQQNLIKQIKKENPYPDENYSCPICERDMKEISKKGQIRLQNWVVDHCHKTKTFRGWICHHCNVGLGALSDDLDRLQNAVEYLRRHDDSI